MSVNAHQCNGKGFRNLIASANSPLYFDGQKTFGDETLTTQKCGVNTMGDAVEQRGGRR